MDKETRNSLQRITQEARQLLAKEYQEQLEGTFDIHPDGTVAPKPGQHLDPAQRLVRQKLVSSIEHAKAKAHKEVKADDVVKADEAANAAQAKAETAEAVQSYLREAAFTTLNRFVALKMLEARNQVQECISKGEESSGFKEFHMLAPGLLGLPDHGYRLYLECLFDEIGAEVKILFDRNDPASLLWPRRQALLNLISILNQQELAGAWGEDETIGWVYQYFNSQEERREMREHAAPRNSHELAVRNQFFTPRYVVCFLGDNTLGRIWYEMRKGTTKLKDECKYMVRRFAEMFLQEGEKAPEAPKKGGGEKTKAELLKAPVYIPHRPKKDPRDLKILDPACGSGHFLLYCFLLLLTIYEEAWADAESPKSGVTGRSLRDDYPAIEELRAAIPELILKHNLHGIDIDQRCAQIAALALWMRAQRAYGDFEISRNKRSPIKKTNIVVAQPMPGETELLEEFIAQELSGTPEEVAVGALIRQVFDLMKLAGDAGSLLKIEEDIKEAVEKAKQHWKAGPRPKQLPLIPEVAQPEQQEIGLEFTGIKDEQFWNEAEGRIYRALKTYAEKAQNGRGFQRKLFVGDAVEGFAFVDICRKYYDVVLMNPPFGQPSQKAKVHMGIAFPDCNDIYAAFVERGLNLLTRRGTLGAMPFRDSHR